MFIGVLVNNTGYWLVMLMVLSDGVVEECWWWRWYLKVHAGWCWGLVMLNVEMEPEGERREVRRGGRGLGAKRKVGMCLRGWERGGMDIVDMATRSWGHRNYWYMDTQRERERLACAIISSLFIVFALLLACLSVYRCVLWTYVGQGLCSCVWTYGLEYFRIDISLYMSTVITLNLNSLDEETFFCYYTENVQTH